MPRPPSRQPSIHAPGNYGASRRKWALFGSECRGTRRPTYRCRLTRLAVRPHAGAPFTNFRCDRRPGPAVFWVRPRRALEVSSMTWRMVSAPVLGALVLATVPALVDCGKLPSNPMGGGACPADIGDAEAVMSAKFGLDGELEGKVKAALAAGANLQALAAQVEADVALACGNLAKDLGAKDIEPKEDG